MLCDPHRIDPPAQTRIANGYWRQAHHADAVDLPYACLKVGALAAPLMYTSTVAVCWYVRVLGHASHSGSPGAVIVTDVSCHAQPLPLLPPCWPILPPQVQLLGEDPRASAGGSARSLAVGPEMGLPAWMQALLDAGKLIEVRACALEFLRCCAVAGAVLSCCFVQLVATWRCWEFSSSQW
jgi:hypothetical protein